MGASVGIGVSWGRRSLAIGAGWLTTFGGSLVFTTGNGSGFGAGGWNGCIGNSTECTTWGLSVEFVRAGLTARAMSSGLRDLSRSTPKMTRPPPNSAANKTSLPLLVLKKFRKSRGFMASQYGWLTAHSW